MLKKVVLIVFNSFKNDSRVLKESISLKKNGFLPIVVALHDDSLKEREDVCGIPVHRIKLKSRKWSKNKIVKIIKYFEFLIRFINIYKKFDIIHCNDLDTLPIGFFVKYFFNKKVKIVYDSHEYAINDKPNEKKYSIKLKFYIENLFIKYADEVITVSDSISSEYSRLYKIKKPSVILNCPSYSPTHRENLFREEFKIRDDQTIFLYQGGLCEGRGIDLLLTIFSSFKNDENVIVFMGYGPFEEKIKEKAQKYNTIFFKDAVHPNRLFPYTSSANYGIYLMEDTCLNHRYSMPNKIFEYIMAGLPVIIANLYEIKKLVLENKIGIIVDPNDFEACVVSINEIKKIDQNLLSENIEKTKKNFNWEQEEKKFLGIYHDL